MKLKTEFIIAGTLVMALSGCSNMEIKQEPVPEGPMEAQITMTAPDGQIIKETKDVGNMDECIKTGNEKVDNGFDVELICADINTGKAIRNYTLSR